ncbi:MAG TPA: hypothetical protein PKY87_16695, partial [Terricaulis sp.]|nr:hypothetical protein [Terricaulis sp.]
MPRAFAGDATCEQRLTWRETLPPLTIYLAAGLSGVTNIVGTFFVKEHLALSAEFIASLGFWVSLPWTLGDLRKSLYQASRSDQDV